MILHTRTIYDDASAECCILLVNEEDGEGEGADCSVKGRPSLQKRHNKYDT